MPYEIKEIKDLSELDGQAEELLGEQEEKEYFKIDNPKKASWALRKLRELQEEEKQVNDIYKAEKEHIDSWKRTEMNRLDYSREYFENGLKLYYEEESKYDPDFKLSTPNGRIGTRKQTKWKYEDDKLVDWLKERNRIDLLNAKPRKSDIKKEFEVVGNKVVDKETGEIVEGITVNEEENFNITIRR